MKTFAQCKEDDIIYFINGLGMIHTCQIKKIGKPIVYRYFVVKVIKRFNCNADWSMPKEIRFTIPSAYTNDFVYPYGFFTTSIETALNTSAKRVKDGNIYHRHKKLRELEFKKFRK